MDLASGPDLSVSTTFRPHGFAPGSRIKMHGAPRSSMTFVVDVPNATTITTKTIIRNSRGFRRHTRRALGAKRRRA